MLRLAMGLKRLRKSAQPELASPSQSPNFIFSYLSPVKYRLARIHPRIYRARTFRRNGIIAPSVAMRAIILTKLSISLHLGS